MYEEWTPVVHDSQIPPGIGASRRILLVDHDGDFSHLMAAGLESRGHIVETVCRVSDATALLRRAAFDLLMVDLQLPDGSGLDLLEYVGNEPTPSADAPIVVISHDFDGGEPRLQHEHLGLSEILDRISETFRKCQRRRIDLWMLPANSHEDVYCMSSTRATSIGPFTVCDLSETNMIAQRECVLARRV
jgi:DNA-binding response OmpR family regulator